MTKITKKLDPSQVVVAIDTREQKPADVSPLKSIRKKLDTADYSIVGMESVVAIERKSLQDFVACCGRERARFEREIERMRGFEVKAIVVEGDWDQLEMKMYPGQMHPNAVIGSALGFVCSGVPIVMAGNAQRAGKFIARLLFTTARRRWESVYPMFSEREEER